MYLSKHTRQKSLQRHLKYWRSKLARLNSQFDTYIKENYKVVDYNVKTPSLRENYLTWRPYGHCRRLKALTARRRCLMMTRTYNIEAKPAVERRNRSRLSFDTDSYDILIAIAAATPLQMT